MNFDSQARIRLYRYTHDANGNEVLGNEIADADKIGGKVAVALEVSVDKNNRVAADANSATIRLKEEPDTVNLTAEQQHPFNQNHWDKTVDLTNTQRTQWEKYYAPDGEPLGWYPCADSPKNPDSSDTPMLYRTRFDWQTTIENVTVPEVEEPDSKLLGHNGSHTVSLESINSDHGEQAIPFECINADGSWSSDTPYQYSNGPDDRSVDVRNLVILGAVTNMGNPDYFAFDPQNAGETYLYPDITFAIGMQSLPHPSRYRWTVKIRSVDSRDWNGCITRTGTVMSLGSITAHMNRPSDSGGSSSAQLSPDAPPAIEDSPQQQSAPLTVRGLYTFDITVEALDNRENVIDTLSYKSPETLTIPHKMPGQYDDNGVQRDGIYVELKTDDNDEDQDGDSPKLVTGYYMDDDLPNDPAGTELGIDIRNVQWALKQSITQTGSNALLRHAYTSIDLYTLEQNEDDPQYANDDIQDIVYKPKAKKEHNRTHGAWPMPALGVQWDPSPRADNYHQVLGESVYDVAKIAAVRQSKLYNAQAGNLNKPGYLAFHSKGASGYDIYQNLFRPKERICFIFAHGTDGGGTVAFDAGKGKIDAYPAPGISSTEMDQHYLINDPRQPNTAIKALLVVFMGCATGLGDYGPGGWGCLPKEAVNKGAKAAVGFTEHIDASVTESAPGQPPHNILPARTWATSLWNALLRGEDGDLNDPQPLHEALAYARDQVGESSMTGNYYGFDSYQGGLYGDQDLMMLPVR